MKKTILIIATTLMLSGCLNPLSLLSGGGSGPTVNANVQAGKENNQSAIDQSRDISGENVSVNQSSGNFSLGGEVGNVKVLNQDIPMWVILLLVLGWVLPSPKEIWVGLLKTITLGRYRG